MALLIAVFCLTKGRQLPRSFLWLANAGLLCFGLSWLTFRKAAAGERCGVSLRRCASCGEARLVIPDDRCPACGSARLAVPFMNRLSLISLTVCLMVPLVWNAQIGGGMVLWLSHAFSMMIVLAPLAFVFWMGRVNQRVLHGPQLESLLTSSELAVPISFFLAGAGIVMAGTLLLMFRF
jgi:hypothetical protein